MTQMALDMSIDYFFADHNKENEAPAPKKHPSLLKKTKQSGCDSTCKELVIVFDNEPLQEILVSIV